MNYPDEEEHHTCLLRPELLLLFQRTKNIEYATAKLAQEEKSAETDEAKKAEENIRRLKEFERHLKEAPKY
jgi:hypothetical protein